MRSSFEDARVGSIVKLVSHYGAVVSELAHGYRGTAASLAPLGLVRLLLRNVSLNKGQLIAGAQEGLCHALTHRSRDFDYEHDNC
jgi:hypothetical protein